MQEVPAPHVFNPCPKDWQTMRGDDKRRFCEGCQLHVHNLSTASDRERADVLGSAKKGAQVCVTYVGERDGMMLVPSVQSWLRTLYAPLRWAMASLLALFLPFWFSGCASRQQTAMMGVICAPGDGGAKDVKAPEPRTTTGAVAPKHP